MGFKNRQFLMREEVHRALSAVSGRAQQLLALSKERAGQPIERVRFACVSDITKFYWCGLMSVLRAREREQMFFDIYLTDRLAAALLTRRIKEIPADDGAILDVCEGFDGERPPAHVWRRAAHASEPDWETLALVREHAEPAGAMQLGDLGETLLARSLPTARWHFAWRDLVIVCEPDGITDDYVYEFKTTKQKSLSEQRKRAITQAQLGAFFFGREVIETEVVALDTKSTKRDREPLSKTASETLLNKFVRAEAGEPIPPPRPYKCKTCDYFDTSACTLSPLKTSSEPGAAPIT